MGNLYLAVNLTSRAVWTEYFSNLFAKFTVIVQQGIPVGVEHKKVTVPMIAAYSIPIRGNILNKELKGVPSDVEKYKSENIVSEIIKELSILI